MGLINFYIISKTPSALELFKDYLIPIIAICVAWNIFKNEQKNETKRWMYSIYAQEESKLWIQYRSQFYDATWELINFIGELDSNPIYDERFEDTVVRMDKTFIELEKAHRQMQIYMQEENLFDFIRIKGLIQKISTFYNTLKLNLNPNFVGHIKIIEDDFPWSQKKYKFKDEANLNKLKFEVCTRAYNLADFLQKKYNLYPAEFISELKDNGFCKDKENYQKAVDIFKKEIDEVNEALDTKILAYKKELSNFLGSTC